MSHICTNDSLIEGGDNIKLKCYLCEKETMHKISYAGNKCLTCGLFMAEFDDFTHAYKILKGKMQRKDIANLLNLSPRTISTYQGSPYGLYQLCEKIKRVKKNGKNKGV